MMRPLQYRLRLEVVGFLSWERNLADARVSASVALLRDRKIFRACEYIIDSLTCSAVVIEVMLITDHAAGTQVSVNEDYVSPHRCLFVGEGRPIAENRLIGLVEAYLTP